LAEMPNLTDLDLSGSEVTDAKLKHLTRAKYLHCLRLDCPKVTDAAVDTLQQLKTLERLDIHDTRISPAGMSRLRAALPGCRFD
jgi:hypothetical protein